MKIKDIIINWICESSLFEMAHERKIALDTVRGLQFTLSKHLIKILHLDAPDQISHWIKEINGYLSIMDRIRIKNGKVKNLKPQDYQLLLWEEPLGHGVEAVSVVLKHLKRDYSNIPRTSLSPHQIYEILHKIYSDLIYDIPFGKFEDIKIYLDRYK